MFSPPVFEDDSLTQHARLIITINNVVLAATAIITAVYPVLEPDRLFMLLYIIPMYFIVWIIRRLTFQGRLIAASVKSQAHRPRAQLPPDSPSVVSRPAAATSASYSLCRTVLRTPV